MELHKTLKEIRRFHGSTQEEICSKFNRHPYPRRPINKAILSKMESGNYSLRAEDFMALCDIYGVGMDVMRDVMEAKLDAFDAVRTKKEMMITRSFMVADGGYQGGVLSFPIGARVLVDTQRQPINGDLVAITSTDMDEGSCCVRKYTRSLGKFLLIAEDKNYPAIELSEEITVLGVVQDVMIKELI